MSACRCPPDECSWRSRVSAPSACARSRRRARAVSARTGGWTITTFDDGNHQEELRADRLSLAAHHAHATSIHPRTSARTRRGGQLWLRRRIGELRTPSEMLRYAELGAHLLLQPSVRHVDRSRASLRAPRPIRTRVDVAAWRRHSGAERRAADAARRRDAVGARGHPSCGAPTTSRETLLRCANPGECADIGAQCLWREHGERRVRGVKRAAPLGGSHQRSSDCAAASPNADSSGA